MDCSFIRLMSRIKLNPITIKIRVALTQKKGVMPRTMNEAATNIATLQIR